MNSSQSSSFHLDANRAVVVAAAQTLQIDFVRHRPAWFGNVFENLRAVHRNPGSVFPGFVQLVILIQFAEVAIFIGDVLATQFQREKFRASLHFLATDGHRAQRFPA